MPSGRMPTRDYVANHGDRTLDLTSISGVSLEEQPDAPADLYSADINRHQRISRRQIDRASCVPKESADSELIVQQKRSVEPDVPAETGLAEPREALPDVALILEIILPIGYRPEKKSLATRMDARTRRVTVPLATIQSDYGRTAVRPLPKDSVSTTFSKRRRRCLIELLARAFASNLTVRDRDHPVR